MIFGRPLQFLCMKVFEQFGVAEFLRIDQGTLYQWTRVMESHYHASNPYHNSTHAGDVMHAAAYFLNLDMLKVRNLVPRNCALFLIDWTNMQIYNATFSLIENKETERPYKLLKNGSQHLRNGWTFWTEKGKWQRGNGLGLWSPECAPRDGDK